MSASAAEATYCKFRYYMKVDEISAKLYVWDIKIRVEPDGVCGPNPIQIYSMNKCNMS